MSSYCIDIDKINQVKWWPHLCYLMTSITLSHMLIQLCLTFIPQSSRSHWILYLQLNILMSSEFKNYENGISDLFLKYASWVNYLVNMAWTFYFPKEWERMLLPNPCFTSAPFLPRGLRYSTPWTSAILTSPGPWQHSDISQMYDLTPPSGDFHLVNRDGF